MQIPYAKKIFDHREKDNLKIAIDDFHLTHGRFCNQFEKQFSEFLNIKYTLLVNSGSSANLLAFMSLTQPELGDRRIKRGDEVITTACCFPTTLAPIVQYGATPVFLDITIPEYNIDIAQLENALCKKTKAVMIAHTIGNPFNVKAVKDFCVKHNLWLIEDCCDAVGGKYKLNNDWKNIGTFGDISTNSFYPAHHLSCGEGGAVNTNNEQLYKIMLSLRDWGKECFCSSNNDNACGHRFDGTYDHKYTYSHFGYNLKATEFQGAILVAQLEKLPEFIKKRNSNWNFFKNSLESKIDDYILPVHDIDAIPSWFCFVITTKSKKGIVMQRELEKKGIQTRPLFAGNIIKQPCFKKIQYVEVNKLTNTNIVMFNTFFFAVHPDLTIEEKEYIISCL